MCDGAVCGILYTCCMLLMIFKSGEGEARPVLFAFAGTGGKNDGGLTASRLSYAGSGCCLHASGQPEMINLYHILSCVVVWAGEQADERHERHGLCWLNRPGRFFPSPHSS